MLFAFALYNMRRKAMPGMAKMPARLFWLDVADDSVTPATMCAGQTIMDLSIATFDKSKITQATV
jgi:hypothetical protein